MKIAILSRQHKLYSTRRLEEEAHKRGHQIKIIDTLRCYMNINTKNPSIHYKGKILDKFDAVIPRIGSSITFYGAALVRQFEMMGTFVTNDSIAITRAQDKLRSLQLLSRRKVGLPITGFAYSPDDIQDLISMVGGPPLVIKILEGTQGIGVVLAETQQAATSVIEAFLDLQAHIMVQEYIKEAKAADIRCFVVNGKVIAAMKRQAKIGEFRSNIHRGGSSCLTTLSEEERATAIYAAKVIGLNIAGVDLLRSNRGPLVMEVNSSPGLEGIEKATKKNIAEIIIKFIEKKIQKHRKI